MVKNIIRFVVTVCLAGFCGTVWAAALYPATYYKNGDGTGTIGVDIYGNGSVATLTEGVWNAMLPLARYETEFYFVEDVFDSNSVGDLSFQLYLYAFEYDGEYTKQVLEKYPGVKDFFDFCDDMMIGWQFVYDQTALDCGVYASQPLSGYVEIPNSFPNLELDRHKYNPEPRVTVNRLRRNCFSESTGLLGVTIPHGMIAPQGVFSTCTELRYLNCGSSLVGGGHLAGLFCCSSEAGTPVVGTATPIYVPNSFSTFVCSGSISPGMSGMTTLRDMTLNVEVVQKNACLDCFGLKKVSFSDDLVELQSGAFQNCTNLSEVTLPRSLKKIGSNAFAGCKNLTAITIPDSVEEIGSGAFQGTSIETLTVPNSVHFCGDLLGDHSLVEKLVVGTGVTNIISITGTHSNLVSLTIRSGKSLLTSSARLDKLESAFLNVEKVDGLGYYSPNLTSLEFGYSVKRINGLRGKSKLEKVVLGDSVEELADWAFSDCADLQSFRMPDSMKSIGTGCFSGCTGLREVSIGRLVEKIGERVFYNCSSLKKVALPTRIHDVPPYAFYGCKNLEDVNLEGSVTNISERCFYNCESLQTVRCPWSVVNVRDNAFYGCTNLQSTVSFDDLETVGNYAFYGTGISRFKTDRLKEIGAYAFKKSLIYEADFKAPYGMNVNFGEGTGNQEIFSSCMNLTNVTMGSGVTNVAYRMFWGCGNLRKTVIPETVKRIGRESFRQCNSLVHIVIPKGVQYIEDSAFAQSLFGVDVELPDSVILLTNAFCRCDLKSIKNVCTVVGDGCFSFCTNLVSCDMSEGLEEVFSRTFYGDERLQRVSLPESLRRVSSLAFYGCKNLGLVELPEKLEYIGRQAFFSIQGPFEVRCPADVSIEDESIFEKVKNRVAMIPRGTWGWNVYQTGAYWHGLKVNKTPIYHYVRLDTRGGTLDTDGITAVEGEVYAELPTPRKVGLAFAGWYTQSQGGELVTAQNYVIPDIETLYAHWGTPIQVTFYDNGKTVCVEEFAENQPFGWFPEPQKDGYTLESWVRGSPSGEVVETSTIVTPSVTNLYAKWKMMADYVPDVRIIDSSNCVLEGSVVKVLVKGGNVGVVSSVDLLVTYNTAATADFDLKRVSVDGAAVKSFKFPVTLKWAAGEIGENTIEIPVPADKAVEADEMLTLQLANPMNLAMGDGATCTVTIRDPQYEEIKAKVAAGTATKTEAEALSKADKVFAGKSYVRGLANDATRGKVTGSALAADGKTVTLKATANKGWVFAGWYTDAACTAGHELAGFGDYRNPSLAYANTNGAVTVYARFIAPEEDSLVLGEDFLPGEFAPGADCSIAVPVESVSYPTVKVTGLPSGMKFADKETLVKATKTTDAYTVAANTIYGAPTKASAKPVVVTVTVKNLGGYQIVRQYEITVKEGMSPVETRARVVSEAAPYQTVAVDLSDDFAGKVTGAGVYQAGKKVTLKATANKGYVFSGWYVEDDLLTRAASYAFTMPSNDVAYVARFVTAEEDAASITTGLDGIALDPAAAFATNVMAGVALQWPVAADALSQTTVAVSGLPAGLKFTAKDVVDSKTKRVTVPANTVYGAPTAASKTKTDRKTGVTTVTPSAVKVTVTTAGKAKRVYALVLTVDPLPAWAVGTFNGGTLEEFDSPFPAPMCMDIVGTASFTVSSSGKVSGKATEGTTTWTLSAPSFTAYDAANDRLVAEVTGKSGANVFTSELFFAEGALGGVATNRTFEAFQGNWKAEPWKTLGKGLANKVLDLGDGATLKFAASGSVSVSAVVGSYKGSASAVLVPTTEPNSEGAFDGIVCVYLKPDPKKGFAGYGRIVHVYWTGDRMENSSGGENDDIDDDSTRFRFDGNGAESGSMEDVIVDYSVFSGSIPPNRFVREGYVFLGWSQTASATDPQWLDGEWPDIMLFDPFESVHTVYAVWGACTDSPSD